jgi:formylglycine-generating enzyme required for sulfatase activity
MKHRPILACLLAAVMIQPVLANNIAVSNVSITDQDSVTKTANIVFDLSWENSWRLTTGPANWDAAWVFVKYHNGDGVWRHAKLMTTAVSHFVPTGASLSVGATGSNGMGAFIYRSAAGSGNVAYSGIKLKWHYGADNILDSAIITADVQAIEMVYVPEGSYYVGDATSGTWCRGDSQGTPFPVTSTQDIQVGNTAGEINTARWSGSGAGTPGSTSTGIVPAEFPNGYAAFYCMKYEVSQGQYARYINTGGSQSPALQYFYSDYNIGQVATGSVPNVTATSPDRAYGGLAGNNNQHTLHYLNWAGVRPMSEFEYEKACRGPVFPVAGEFAWGTAVVANLAYTLSGFGTATEAVSANYNENAGNAWYSTTKVNNFIIGSCRVGMFAKSAYAGSTPPRIQSGSSYWGILDLTGNVAELAAPVNFATQYGGTPSTGMENYVQRSGTYYTYTSTYFRGSHGTGGGGYPVDWGLLASDSTYLSVWKGGSWIDNLSSHAVSSSLTAFGAGGVKGIRGVRAAP